VGVGIRRVRHVEVDDVRDALHVDAACRDVRRHQHVEVSLAEALHGAIALGLRHVALEADGAVAGTIELLRQPARPVLRAREDDGRLTAILRQDALEQVPLAILPDRHEHVLDGLGGAGSRELHHLRIAQQGVGEPPDLGRHRRGEEQVLTLRRQLRQDAPQIGQEAHVEHVVRLVEDEGLHVAEAERALVDQVEEAARAADDDLRVPAQRLRLSVGRDATEDGDDLEPGEAREGADLRIDLCGELARGRQHEGARSASPLSRLPQAVQQGQGEGGRLAGAGLGEAQHVTAGERRGNRLDLDRSGFEEARGDHAAEQGGVESEPVEAGGRIGQRCSHE
jgi:hypothetical protein